MMEPAFDCPRFQKCSVNNCPLFSGYPDMFASPNDSERTCTIAKSVRLRVAVNYPTALRYGGMTAREWVAAQQWSDAESTPKNAMNRETSTFVSAVQTKVGAAV